MTGESPLDRFRRWYGLLPPALRFLMTVNTVVFAAWIFVRLSQPAASFAVEYFALTPTPRAFLRPWQFLTYSVFHVQVGLWGLIAFGFNMLWLYWMGKDYEETYGSHRLFGLYVLAALGGGLLAVLVGSVLPGARMLPIEGAFVPVFGVLFCVAALFPNRGIGLFLLGVVPMKWLAGGFLVFSVVFSLGNPALALAYVGGAGVGFLFGKLQEQGTDLAAWAQMFFPSGSTYGGTSVRSAPPSGKKGGMLSRIERWLAGKSRGEEASGRSSRTRPSQGSPRGSEPSRRRSSRVSEPVSGPGDIDRILDKINERGYDALTEDEKRILYEASQDE